jgi:hypothetical protein
MKKSIRVELSNGDAIVLNPFGLGVFAYRKETNGNPMHLGSFDIHDGQWFWSQLEDPSVSAAELEVILGWMKKDPFKVEPTFSEVTLSNGDRTIVIHVWTDDRITIADDKRSNWKHWGSAGPSKQTVIRWIKMQLHGDLSQEPEFVRIRLAGIRHRGHSGMISGPNPETDDSEGDIEP